jgi:hypothetical protein
LLYAPACATGAFLGRKLNELVLPRVAAALSQFIKPVDSSRETHPDRDGNSPGPQDYQRPQSRSSRSSPKGKGKLALVPESTAAPPASSEAQEQQKSLSKKLEPPRALGGVAEALVGLLLSLAKNRATFLKWLGPRAYRNTLIARKKATNFRKGSILDIKIE